MLLFPGQGVRTFTIKRENDGISNSGRVQAKSYDVMGEFVGFLTSATPKEQEQWKQNGHPITHKVVQHLPLANGYSGMANDLLELDGRIFTVQGVRNPGEINHFNVYYCEERRDIKCPKSK